MHINQPHTSSYYAATVNEHTDYPSLKGEITADVCVIGAGFTGVSTALHLSERGYKVHLVEAHKVGWGASGRNGGQMIGGISGAIALYLAPGWDNCTDWAQSPGQCEALGGYDHKPTQQRYEWSFYELRRRRLLILC